MSQYILCRVLDQKFTVSILSTNRIIPLKEVTHVPDTSEYVMGIMEAEGEVLPIIDLSQRFFEKPIKDEAAAQVIIVYWKGKEIGIAVNEVLTIKDFSDEQIDHELEKITRLNQNSDYTPIKSFIRSEEGLILEVDIDELFETSGTLEVQQLFDDYEASDAADNVEEIEETEKELVRQNDSK
ncbi:chemotaxis protein CheW [Carnobacteriaceae bacterium 52-44]